MTSDVYECGVQEKNSFHKAYNGVTYAWFFFKYISSLSFFVNLNFLNIPTNLL